MAADNKLDTLVAAGATSWCIRTVPILLLGNQTGRLNRSLCRGSGSSQQFKSTEDGLFSLPYLAWTTEGGTHLRFGARWDDVDQYYTFPSIAIARPFRTRIVGARLERRLVLCLG